MTSKITFLLVLHILCQITTLYPMKTITINDASCDQRFDRFLRKYFKHTPEIKLGDIFSWIRKGSIKVNDKKKKQDYRLKIGDVVTWDESISTEKKAWQVLKKKEKKLLDIELSTLQDMLLHEDENFLIRNKPANTLIHPGDKHTTDVTLHDMMVSYLRQTKQRNANDTYSPSFCYRLDKDTSGVVISAKTYAALQYLNEAIRERKTNKGYTAILVWDLGDIFHGKYPHKLAYTKVEWQRISVKAPLFVWYNRSTWRSQCFVNKEKWKESRSDFSLVKSVTHPTLGRISLVKIKLYTWRMHQIRVHAAHIWFPVLWDLTYGIPAVNRVASKQWITRQLLHASSYWFFDQFVDSERKYTAPLPAEFNELFSYL